MRSYRKILQFFLYAGISIAIVFTLAYLYTQSEGFNDHITNDHRNVYLYWVGKEPALISILRKLIRLHSTNGRGYRMHLITDKNITEYVKNIPDYFNTLKPAHQADFVRVNVVCDYGGIWLDSDTLVLDTLDSLFDIIEKKDGFFITENSAICNGVFGSKPNTPLMIEWKNKMIQVLDQKNGVIDWSEIGSVILQKMRDSNPMLYEKYTIFNGLDNMYPIYWTECIAEFIEKPYENYKNIIRDYQPLLVLVNSVYNKLGDKTEQEILDGKMPLNYFINKSFENGEN